MNKRLLLASTPLFFEPDEGTLDALIHITKTRQLTKGEIVVKQGDPGSEMYIVVEGKLKVSVSLGEGKEISLSILRPNEAFGEIALFDRHERTATITAIEPACCLVIERDLFVPFLKEHPDVAIRLLGALSRRLRQTDAFIKETLCFDIPSCLAKKLLDLAKGYGQQTYKGIRINAIFSEEDLEQITGVPRESITAQFRSWQDKGLISYRSRHITIKDLKEMERLI